MAEMYGEKKGGRTATFFRFPLRGQSYESGANAKYSIQDGGFFRSECHLSGHLKSEICMLRNTRGCYTLNKNDGGWSKHTREISEVSYRICEGNKHDREMKYNICDI